MKYMGSKNRIAKHILPIILKDRKPNQYYVEPFVGGANMIDKVDGYCLGGEYNKYIAYMWIALKKGWIPPKNIDKGYYQYCKELYLSNTADERQYYMIGYVGVCCSYSGKWFGGYAGKVETRKGLRDYQAEAFNNTIKQVENIKNIDFVHSCYLDLKLPKDSIIYCDPPYKGTTQYKDGFDHEKFYDWCREKAKQGHKLFVSEYNMPDDFKCVWEKEVKSSLSANGKVGGNKNSIERLFTVGLND